MRSPLCFVVCVLALAPSCGFVRRTRVGRAVATRATGETYNGMYDRRGRPRRGKPDPEQTYYAYDGSVVESPAKFSRTVRRRGYAPPWLFHYTSKASAQDIMDASRLRASTDDGSNTDVKYLRPRGNPTSAASAEYPGRGRGAVATSRLAEIPTSAASAEYPRRGRGAAATRRRTRPPRKNASQVRRGHLFYLVAPVGRA